MPLRWRVRSRAKHGDWWFVRGEGQPVLCDSCGRMITKLILPPNSDAQACVKIQQELGCRHCGAKNLISIDAQEAGT